MLLEHLVRRTGYRWQPRYLGQKGEQDKGENVKMNFTKGSRRVEGKLLWKRTIF
jgi:hypothetical protein